MILKETMKTEKKIEPKKIRRRIVLIDGSKSQWADHLQLFLEDSTAEFLHVQDPAEANAAFSQRRPDICFLNPEYLTTALVQKIKVLCEIDKSFHLFLIGEDSNPPSGLPYACSFEVEECGYDFLKKFSKHLKLPEHVNVLVADDDPEIRSLMESHLVKSSYPVFNVVCAEDGAEAIRQIKQGPPDIVILDMQMPKKDGRDVYAYIQSLDRKIPVIVYLDIFSSEQIMSLYKLGRPVVIDKSGEGSSLAYVSSFIKKVLYLES